MSEVYINSSGEYNEIVDGELVNNAEYVASYDGDMLDLAIKNNDEEYFTRLDNNELLNLLNIGHYPMERDNLIIRLQNDFPIKKQKSKSRSKKKSRKGKTKREKRLTKREKIHLIESVFSGGNPHTPTI